MYTKMEAVYSDHSYVYTTNARRCNKFRQERESTKYLDHPGPTGVAAL